MGELIAGQWRRGGVEKLLEDGRLRRPTSLFRNWIGLSDADKTPAFPAEAGRYHLYVSLACPWAHRTLIMRRLKGLEEIVGLSVAHWLMGEDGWSFQPGPGVIPDTVNGVQWLHQLYTLSEPDCSSRVTVPVLWDKDSRKIVSNESAEILRIFNSAFDRIGAAEGDYCPADLRSEIDAINERVYVGLNNGVYRAGFAATQAAYEAAVADVFETLDWLEERLETRRFLVGERLTEADIRLFTTLVRFDVVYYGHFKCNLRALVDYPRLWRYTRALYRNPAIRPTVDFGHIKGHYYGSHPWLNLSGVVPIGPRRDFDTPLELFAAR
ncbi:glutathione S-transferase family protein [Methylosinus sp. RM1]|uniref:glutathione S-transferase family protein n=1 Tax=Methylosinus sp. RM1 TaxID=2583817 RepID=UPI00140AA951|nr:glutathione S-transferase family protein [Methylosinus sp. RM1]